MSKIKLASLEKPAFFLLAAMVAALLGQYCYFLLHDAGFVLGDQDLFIRALRDGFIPMPQTGGRFWPLVLQEYRPLLLLKDYDAFVAGVFLMSCLKLALFALCIYLAARRYLPKYLAVAVALFILAYTRSFLIYALAHGAESTLMTLWAVWLCLFLKAGQTDKLFYYILSALAATTLFYLKETAFALFLPASGVVLLANFKSLSRKARSYHFFIIAQFFIFMTLYYFIVYRNTQEFHNAILATATRFDVLFQHINDNKIIILGFIFALVRGGDFWAGRRVITLADMLLMNSFSFIFGCVVLRLGHFYYIVPALPALIMACALYGRDFIERLSSRAFYRKAALKPVKVLLVTIFVIMACRGMILGYKANYRDMLDTHNQRISDAEIIDKLISLKADGFNFIKYTPGREFYANRVESIKEHWIYGSVLVTFISFLSHDPNFSSLFLYGAALSDDIIKTRPAGTIYIFGDIKKLGNFINTTKNKIAFIDTRKIKHQIINAFANRDDVFTLHTSRFKIYTTSLPESLLAGFTEIIDLSVANLPYFIRIKGISEAESWGRWADGSQLKIKAALPARLKGKPLVISLPVVKLNGEQKVLPALNGRALAPLTLTAPQTLNFKLPPEVMDNLELTLDLPDAKAPADSGRSSDKRKLSIGLKEITIAEDAAPAAPAGGEGE